MKGNTIYVVNETNELENDIYTTCHGVYENKKDAYKKAREVYEIANTDIKLSEYDEENLSIWNDACRSITTVIETKIK